MSEPLREASYWEMQGERVHCFLCPQDCRIAPGRKGVCGVRLNRDSKLWATNYAKCTARSLDPTEKKPLYHFYPGSHLLSLGTLGCNLKCGFCQNWEISQGDAPYFLLTPDEAVRCALESKSGDPRSIGLAYTYSEPLMWFEYVLDTSRKARENGLKNVLVTNGYINPEPFEQLLEFIDAANIDVKAFSQEFYQELCKGRLEPVLKSVAMAHEKGCHVEVTTLIVPGHNDDPREVESLAKWLGRLDRSIPLHLSRYYPHYRFNVPPTPVDTLKRAREVALEHLSYVYLGNVPGDEGSMTRCPKCGHIVLKRVGMALVESDLAEGNRCPRCQWYIAIKGRIVSK